MSAVAVLSEIPAERIKLSTTRSVLWAVAAVAVLSIGLAAVQGFGPANQVVDRGVKIPRAD